MRETGQTFANGILEKQLQLANSLLQKLFVFKKTRNIWERQKWPRNNISFVTFESAKKWISSLLNFSMWALSFCVCSVTFHVKDLLWTSFKNVRSRCHNVLKPNNNDCEVYLIFVEWRKLSWIIIPRYMTRTTPSNSHLNRGKSSTYSKG